MKLVILYKKRTIVIQFNKFKIPFKLLIRYMNLKQKIPINFVRIKFFFFKFKMN